MADTYWKICEGAAPSVQSPYHPVEWSCPCHGTLGERPLIPVPAGALLIEDREQAIEQGVTRIAMLIDEWHREKRGYWTQAKIEREARVAFAQALAAAEGRET